MSWIGSALGVYQIALGVDAFGQSGTIPDLYRINNLDTESIVKAATFAITKKKFSKNWSHND
jgi:pyruvate dehydrogenase E1 component